MNTISTKPDQSTSQTSGQPGAAAIKISSIFALVLIGLAGATILVNFNPARMDYISYWSAARMLVHHGGPYSPDSILTLEKSTGFLHNKPLMMRNPPWALFLVAPLGFLGPRVGEELWFFTLVACIIVSVHLLNPRSKDNALLLFFAPVIACFVSGQTSPFLLLGFALFLHLHQRRPYLAGAALLIMAIKPHLFLVFWAVLLAESLYQKNFRILAGLAAALALATAFAMALDPHVWPEYISMMRTSALQLETFPTASELFRLLIAPKAVWLLFVPSLAAALWGIWHYARNRHQWDWTSHGMLLILVTILTSPYGWFTDEVVLLPALVYALNLPERRKHAGWILLALNIIPIIIISVVGFIHGFSLESPFLAWTPLAWLAWFLYATYRHRAQIPSKNQISPACITSLETR